jgi:photosystem II stability/assembly factor-like uncharacterized protein
MIRRLLVCTCVLLLTACAPELIPVPITQSAPQVLATPTTPALAAPTVAVPNLITIHMVDEMNGWGINDAAVVRTIDGGKTWYNVSPSGESTLGYAVDSDFLDLDHAWILVPDPNNMLAGSLYRTSDGGTNWTKSAAPFGGGDLHFLDAKRGWMMASLGAGAGSMGVGVFQTTDGGATWTQTYANDPNQPGAGDSLPLGGLKDGIAAIDMKNAWIGGVTYAPGVIYLYQTHDGGHTWMQSPVKIPDGYDQAEFETTGPIFADATLAYLPVHVSSQNGVMLAIYLSRDGGASWLLTPTLIPMGGSFDAVSDQVAVAWNGTNFYLTTDSAQTWSIVPPDIRFSDNFSGMDFVNPQVGYVLTNDGAGAFGLYRTTDGAATWNILSR